MKPDPVHRIVRIQQRAIRRGSRYLVDGIERFGTGRLSPETWLSAYVDYIYGIRADFDEILAICSGADRSPRDSDGDANG